MNTDMIVESSFISYSLLFILVVRTKNKYKMSSFIVNTTNIYSDRTINGGADYMIVFDVNRDDNKKNSTVPIRVTEEEKRKLHLAAHELGLSVSQLIRLSVEFYLYENL